MKLADMFSKPKYLLIFIFLLVLTSAFYLVVTGAYVVSLGQFNQNIEPLRVALTILISILTALVFTVLLYKQTQPLVCKQTAPGLFGSFMGLFATACPICFPLLLSLIGVGGSAALAISQNTVPIQLASIALLLASIWLTFKR